MSKLWFTADLHFNHANIIKYCKRPFKNVEQMNDKLIKNNNSRVKPEDTVYDLGDFIFRNSPGGKKGEGGLEKAEYFLNHLIGKRIQIKGNHDRNNSLKTPNERIVIRYGGFRMNLVHNPIHADPSYIINLVGHVHEKWKFKKLGEKSYLINVGVDVWDFKPVSFEEIMKGFRKWKKELIQNEKTAKQNEDEQGGTQKEVQPQKMGK